MEADSAAKGLGEFLDFSFPFVNPGPKPVTVLNVETSCGCMTPELAKRQYLVGERGVLNVRVKATGEGTSIETIFVATSDAPQAPTILKISLTMPSTLKVSPQPLVWKRGGPAEPKEAQVRVGKDINIKVGSVFCADPYFKVECLTVKSGRYYRVRITPRSTDQRRSGTIHFEFEGLTAGCVDTWPIYVAIK